jgi:hypothetical protein
MTTIEKGPLVESTEQVNRRNLVIRAAKGLAAVLGVAGCRKKLGVFCEGGEAMPPSDVQLRSALAYVDTTTEPEKSCLKCFLYLPPKVEESCGTCKVVRGPIHPNGTCRVFLKQQPA